MWEDDRNRRGGRWVINLNKSQRSTSLDNFWLEVMLCLIGEAFDEHSRYVRKQTQILREIDLTKFFFFSGKWGCCFNSSERGQNWYVVR